MTAAIATLGWLVLTLTDGCSALSVASRGGLRVRCRRSPAECSGRFRWDTAADHDTEAVAWHHPDIGRRIVEAAVLFDDGRPAVGQDLPGQRLPAVRADAKNATVCQRHRVAQCRLDRLPWPASIQDLPRISTVPSSTALDAPRYGLVGLPTSPVCVASRLPSRVPLSLEDTMAGIFNIHRTWEDWASMVLGVLIGFSPWLAGQQGDQMVNGNAVIVGALVIALGALELTGLQRWEQGGEIACGLWLIVSPFIFGYAEADALRYWHFVLGALVALLAVVELWQDWNLSDKELAQHGQ